MAEDTTGMIEALADERPFMVEASPRTQQFAAAMALIRDGMSLNEAAKTTGLPQATLWRHSKGYSMADTEKSVQKNERALIGASFDIAQIAADKITHRLLDDDHDWKDGDLVKVYGVATDKIAMKRQWNKGQHEDNQEQGISTLARLLQGKKLTIEDADPAEQAIDIEAVTEPSK